MSEAGKVSLPVTIASLPEEAITELDERIGELWRDEGGDYETEEYITDSMMSTFNLLTIGYDAAWTEVERLSAALEEAEQNATKWEKAFDNADKQYLKVEKQAGDLRRSLDKFQKLASDNHTLAAKFERELAEAQQTIETLRIAKEYDIELHAQSCNEYQQTIARQREALTYYADGKHHDNGSEVKDGTVARGALWEGAKEL